MNQRIFSTSYRKVHKLLWPVRNKWYNLGIALDVDPSTLESIKKSNQSNCDDCFNAMLKSCSERNTITWFGLCEALRSDTVNNEDVAQKIEEEIPKKATILSKRKRSHHNSASDGGSVASDNEASEDMFEEKSGIINYYGSTKQEPVVYAIRLVHFSAGAPATSSSVVTYKRGKMRSYSTPDDEKMDLVTESRSIDDAFIKLKRDTMKSLTGNKTEPEDLKDYLQNFGREKAAVSHGNEEDKVLLDSFDDLEKDNSITAIFKRINNFLSFLDYHLLEKIIEEYGEDEDRANLVKYVEQLTDFLENWQVKPLVVNESTEDQTKLNFKLDTYSLTCYNEIKRAIAKLFKRPCCDVVVISIDSGCVELVFALPTTAVERLPSLTLSQIAEVAEWTPTVLNVKVLDGKDNIFYEVSFPK